MIPPTFNWSIVVGIIIVLVFLDKGLTYLNVHQVEKNYSHLEALSIEKNPIVKWMFKEFGLIGGTILSFLLSIVTFILALLVLDWSLHFFTPNSASISLYILMIIYGLVIANNLYFLLKFSRVIP